jgi:hypothetical protein
MNNNANPTQNGAAPQDDAAKIDQPLADAASQAPVAGDPVQDDAGTKAAPRDGTTIATPTKSV